MKLSYNWLQSYFENKLPEPEKLSDILTFSFAEVEGLERKGDDTIFDISVLPDRACYALSHRGVAYEISASLRLPKKDMSWPMPETAKTRGLSVEIEEPGLCPRYIARVVENINPKQALWVKDHLESVDQRSINPIVDGTNLVMFDMGQPMHVFDADKVSGGIVVRMAKEGEKITVLSGEEIEIDSSILVIADNEGPLAIAGIKGGKKAEVTDSTKNVILESANFDSSYIRKAGEVVGIKTDSSKRFENGVSVESAKIGIDNMTAFLFEMDKEIKVGEIVDKHKFVEPKPSIKVSEKLISDKLGSSVSKEDIIDVLKRLDIEVKEENDDLVLTVPHFRSDLNIPEDIVEEIGRIIGYDKIPESKLPEVKDVQAGGDFAAKMIVRTTLPEHGFSEIYGYTFGKKGDMEIIKPLSSDKAFLRKNLSDEIDEKLTFNLSNNLFDNTPSSLFEIGSVFPGEGERVHLALGIKYKKKKFNFGSEIVSKALNDLFGKLEISESYEDLIEDFEKGNTQGVVVGKIEDDVGIIIELDFDKLISLSESRGDFQIPELDIAQNKFKTISPYPRIIRDIAIFVSEGTSSEEVSNIIKEKATELLSEGPVLFDEFSKDGRKSLAFRMAFQSEERTLSDDEVNKIMEEIYTAIGKNGWEIR